MKKPLEEEDTLLEDGNKWCWIKRHICLDDVNDQFLYSDGYMSRYLTDKDTHPV
jgi:hypothetical protein